MERRSKRERAIGGMMVEIRCGIEVERVMIKEGTQGLVAIEIKLGRERMVDVYINGDIEEKLKRVRGWKRGIQGLKRR